ncbi:MAG: sulfotransferase [Phenylobacterium sp.]|nr:sulfotransferase [Phenylobacterium sp.]
MQASAPEKIVFVGGAPRSGTTVAHALICTSARFTRYHPEISFYRGIALAYRNGAVAWDQHTSAFFSDREAFRAHMREHSDLALRRIWDALDRRPILACKDPLLTRFFPDLAQLHPENAVFVVTVRNPIDIVRSRQEVHERAGSGRPFSAADAVGVAREMMEAYQAVLSTDFGGRLFALRYEDLADARIHAELGAFLGVSDLDPANMWGTAPDQGDDPWGSPKYYGKIDLSPRLSPLDALLAGHVRQTCAPLMRRFNYE